MGSASQVKEARKNLQ